MVVCETATCTQTLLPFTRSKPQRTSGERVSPLARGHTKDGRPGAKGFRASPRVGPTRDAPHWSGTRRHRTPPTVHVGTRTGHTIPHRAIVLPALHRLGRGA